MDINNLFRSKTRRELFRLYFSNPDSEYYLRELERLLKIPVSMIRKELLALEQNGLFRSRRCGNLAFYFLNKSYLLFNEMKSIVFKTIGVRGLLENELAKIKGLELAFIYGSYAKNEATSESDVDLFVVGDVDDDDLLIEIRKAEKLLAREINYNLYGRAEFEREQIKEGSFVNLVLKDKIIFLKGSIYDCRNYQKTGKTEKNKKS